MRANDRMPPFDSPEMEVLTERALKLSTKDVCELLGYVGITYTSEISPGEPATYAELKDLPKDMLLSPLDEADSLEKVERFLKERGV